MRGLLETDGRDNILLLRRGGYQPQRYLCPGFCFFHPGSVRPRRGLQVGLGPEFQTRLQPGR